MTDMTNDVTRQAEAARSPQPPADKSSSARASPDHVYSSPRDVQIGTAGGSSQEVNSTGSMRRRRRTTAAELAVLEREFLKCDKPPMGERDRISREIVACGGNGMNGREIQVWFQNKRQAMRRVATGGPVGSAEKSSARKDDRARPDGDVNTSFMSAASSESNSTQPDEEPQQTIAGRPRHNSVTPPGVLQFEHYYTPDSIARDAATKVQILPVTAAAPSTKTRGETEAKSAATQSMAMPPNRRKAGVLLANLDGRAEVMFSAPPLKPASPPREPQLITPIKTPINLRRGLSSTISRSASSPALLSMGMTPAGTKSRSPAQSLMNSAQAASTLQAMHQDFSRTRHPHSKSRVERPDRRLPPLSVSFGGANSTAGASTSANDASPSRSTSGPAGILTHSRKRSLLNEDIVQSDHGSTEGGHESKHRKRASLDIDYPGKENIPPTPSNLSSRPMTGSAGRAFESSDPAAYALGRSRTAQHAGQRPQDFDSQASKLPRRSVSAYLPTPNASFTVHDASTPGRERDRAQRSGDHQLDNNDGVRSTHARAQSAGSMSVEECALSLVGLASAR